MAKKNRQLPQMIEENVTLYPPVETVFKDTRLGIYFRPLLTARMLVADKPYNIHLLGTDGLVCKEDVSFPYAENYFFGFKYNNGHYEFLGNLEVFEEHSRIPALHAALTADFRKNRDEYLAAKTSIPEYMERITAGLIDLSAFSDMAYAEYYEKAFYSYEFTKYYYEKYGRHQHISVVTQGYAKNTEPFLMEEENAQDILEEFFINLEDNLANDYGIKEELFVCGTERYRFMSRIGGGDVLALADSEKDIIYILEYAS